MQIDANSVSSDQRKHLHGQFQGTQVNSPQMAAVGESMLIWPEAGKPHVVSMSKAALGVLAMTFLRDEGYTVEKHASQHGAGGH